MSEEGDYDCRRFLTNAAMTIATRIGQGRLRHRAGGGFLIRRFLVTTGFRGKQA
jgi:hypothetical protein